MLTISAAGVLLDAGLVRTTVTATECAAQAGITLENTISTEPLFLLRYFGPELVPKAPSMGAYRP